MAIPKKAPPPADTIVRVREQYVQGLSVAAIAAGNGLKKHQVYVCLDGGPRGPDRLPALPRRRVISLRQTALHGKTSLVEKLWRAARRKVEEVEDRLARAGITDVEHEARAMAMLVKTLRVLAALDDTRASANDTNTEAAADDGPRDMDEFRRDLARRMDAIVASRKDRGPDQTDSGTG